MKKMIYLAILLFIFYKLNAQNAYTDSLTNRLNHPKTTAVEKMKIYALLVEHLRSEDQYDKAITINNRLIALAKNKKDNFELTKAFVNQGIIYNNRNDYEKDRIYLDSARVASVKSKNKLAVAYSDYLAAYILNSYEDYESAIKSFQRLLLNIEDTDDDFLKGKAYYHLYGIYSNWNDQGNTLLYANKVVESALKSGDKNFLSNAYSVLAVAYTYQYDEHKKKEDLDKIFEICEKSIDLNQRYKGQVTSRTYAIAKLNIASYYLKYYPEKHQLIKEKTFQALEAAKLAPGNQRIVASCYGILSTLAQNEKNLSQAETYLNAAYQILLTETPIYFHTMIQVCEDLAALYEKTGRYQNAYNYQKLTTEYNMQLFNEQQATISKRLQAQYQFEKKEEEVKTLKERSESQRKQKLLYAGLGIISLLGSFFMFRSYHFRLRYSLEQEKQLKTEKHEAELQIKLEKEEQSRLKAEQELLTLQQEKLQNEVMVNQLHIQHKNEVLQQLKVKLEDDQSLNINQIIREEHLLDNDFEKAKFQIQELHPNFFKNLNENAKQKLTSLDLKYCAYFYLGIDTKQIANLLNVEPKSVRMTKYRLKQKFELDAETDLVSYLKLII